MCRKIMNILLLKKHVLFHAKHQVGDTSDTSLINQPPLLIFIDDALICLKSFNDIIQSFSSQLLKPHPLIPPPPPPSFLPLSSHIQHQPCTSSAFEQIFRYFPSQLPVVRSLLYFKAGRARINTRHYVNATSMQQGRWVGGGVALSSDNCSLS